MLYIKAAGKAVQTGHHSSPQPSSSDSMGRDTSASSASQASSSSGPSASLARGLLGVIDHNVIPAMDGRKPSESEYYLNTSTSVKQGRHNTDHDDDFTLRLHLTRPGRAGP